MRVTLYLSVKDREQALRNALVQGFTKHGDTVRSKLRKEFGIDTEAQPDDLAVFVGVKSLRIWKKCMEAKRRVMIIDKSYFSRNDYVRMSVGGYQPIEYLPNLNKDTNRLTHLGVQLAARKHGAHIVYAGSSGKYCAFHELGDPTEYANKVCELLRDTFTKRQILYRPKPSWWVNDDEVKKSVPVGTVLSHPNEQFHKLLLNAHCVVTHGSNAAVEALAAGVPVLLTSEIGISPVYTLCEHDIGNLETPYWPTAEQRDQLLSNLAWCQFSLGEIASGFAWANIKPHVR